mmetsp:Transcript_21508/g.61475  ORF Transcript_21508/g.61475 Transcript_21508/m.61475 type:complete len:211 (-) Transcript_21508:1437-2069(-)
MLFGAVDGAESDQASVDPPHREDREADAEDAHVGEAQEPEEVSGLGLAPALPPVAFRLLPLDAALMPDLVGHEEQEHQPGDVQGHVRLLQAEGQLVDRRAPDVDVRRRRHQARSMHLEQVRARDPIVVVPVVHRKGQVYRAGPGADPAGRAQVPHVLHEGLVQLREVVVLQVVVHRIAGRVKVLEDPAHGAHAALPTLRIAEEPPGRCHV